jgi:hypothetical protein
MSPKNKTDKFFRCAFGKLSFYEVFNMASVSFSPKVDKNLKFKKILNWKKENKCVERIL